jgi:hypothetical protein
VAEHLVAAGVERGRAEVVGDPDLGDRPLGADGRVGLADHPGDPRRQPGRRHPLGELWQPVAHEQQALAQRSREVGREPRLAEVAQQLVGHQPRLVGHRVEVVPQAGQRHGGPGHREQLLATAGDAVQPAQRLHVLGRRRWTLHHEGTAVLVVAAGDVGVRAVLDPLAPRVDEPTVDEDEVAEPATVEEPFAGIAPEHVVVVAVVEHRSSWCRGV